MKGLLKEEFFASVAFSYRYGKKSLNHIFVSRND